MAYGLYPKECLSPFMVDSTGARPTSSFCDQTANRKTSSRQARLWQLSARRLTCLLSKYIPKSSNFGFLTCSFPTQYRPACEILKELHWLMAFKCVNGIAPEYLAKMLPQHLPGRDGLCSTDENWLAVPLVRRKT